EVMIVYVVAERACKLNIFFFEAEDGIRAVHVTGVQTCALPISANKVNYLSQDPYPQEIAEQFTNQDASRLYLHGGSGSIVEVDISNGSGNALNELQEARSKGWLINEASLVFYVDETALGQEGVATLPKRIYLYDYQNERPLIDYNVDLSQNTGVDSTSYAIFDGR